MAIMAIMAKKTIFLKSMRAAGGDEKLIYNK
jgi:hypothetical protein